MNDKDDPRRPAPPEENLDDQIGGVQGAEDEDLDGDNEADRPAQTATPGTRPDEPAPDGAEIEWAGGLIKKPPSPK